MDRLPTAYEMVCRKLDKAEKEIERLRNLLLKGIDVQTVCEMEMWRADVRKILKEK